MRILLLLRSLDTGGTERQAAVLAAGLAAAGHEVAVAVFYAGGALEAELAAAQVPVIDLAKRGRWDLPAFLLGLRRVVRRFRPDVVYGLLAGPNCFGTLALAGLRLPLVFGIRASDMDPRLFGWGMRLLFVLEARLARYAALSIANSQQGIAVAGARGFPADRLLLIPNGIDTGRFRPDPQARTTERAGLGLAAGERLVATIGRLDPMKDHPTFLRAAAVLARRRSDLRFAIIGDGATDAAAALTAQAASLGLGDRFRHLPARPDIERLYPALDLFILSSTSEGFPNALAEAMACGIPAVSTRVGEAASILGDETLLAMPGDWDGLAAAAGRALDGSASEAPAARIARLFSTERMVEATATALAGVARRKTVLPARDAPRRQRRA